MIFLSAFFRCKAHIKHSRFQKNATLGDNFTCDAGSNCINASGDKSRIQIASHCEICGILSVDVNGQITIGDHTTIRYASCVESGNQIEIGSHVIISNNVIIRDNNSHPTDPATRWEMCENGFYGDPWTWKHASSAPIIIHDNVWIGERSILYKGVEIGAGSIIAGGAVVTKSFPPYSVIAGNPARLVKSLR